MHFLKSIVISALMFGAAVMGAPTAANEEAATIDKRSVRCKAFVNMTVRPSLRFHNWTGANGAYATSMRTGIALTANVAVLTPASATEGH